MKRFYFHWENDDESIRGMSYRLYAFLNQLVGNQQAYAWHQQQQTPLHQCLYRDGDQIIWRVALISQEAESVLAPKLSSLRKIILNGRQWSLKLIKQEEIPIEQLVQFHLFQQPAAKQFSIQWLTPTAYRVAGHYDTLPNIERMLNGLAQTWQKFYPDVGFWHSDMSQSWRNYCFYTRYRLQSTSFSFKKVHVPSFMGEATLSVTDHMPLARLVGLLISAGSWSGCGIKTALGMGGIRVLDQEDWQSFPSMI